MGFPDLLFLLFVQETPSISSQKDAVYPFGPDSARPKPLVTEAAASRRPKPMYVPSRGPPKYEMGCFPMLFKHRSFEKPAVFPGFLRVS